MHFFFISLPGKGEKEGEERNRGRSDLDELRGSEVVFIFPAMAERAARSNLRKNCVNVARVCVLSGGGSAPHLFLFHVGDLLFCWKGKLWPVYKIKAKGAITLPCGTPRVIGVQKL